MIFLEIEASAAVGEKTEEEIKQGRHRGHKVLFGFLMGLLAGSPAAAQDLGSALSLEAAVERALQAHPRAREASFLNQRAEAALQETRAGRWPSLQLGESFTRSNNPVFVFASRLAQGRLAAPDLALDALNHPSALSNFRTSLTLRLPLFDRFQTASRIKQAVLRQREAEAELGWTAQQLRFQVIQAYYGLLLAGAELDTARQAVRMAEAEVRRLRDHVREGTVVRSDLLALEVQLAEFRQAEIRAEGGLVSARAALNLLLEFPVQTAIHPSDGLQPRTFPLPSREQLLQEALRFRPDYQQAGWEVERQSQELRSRRGAYWPALDLFAEWGHSASRLSGGSSDFALGARLSFPLLELGREGAIRASQAARDAARERQRQQASAISLEVVQAYQEYQAAQAGLEVADRALEQAREVLRIVEDRYRVGLTPVTELLRAQTALVRSRLTLLRARYETYLGYARILLATGRLEDVRPFTS